MYGTLLTHVDEEGEPDNESGKESSRHNAIDFSFRLLISQLLNYYNCKNLVNKQIKEIEVGINIALVDYFLQVSVYIMKII